MDLLERERLCLQKQWQRTLMLASSISQCQASHLRYYNTQKNWTQLILMFNLVFFLIQWLGVADNYVKAVFSLAKKNSPCVIFMDEVIFYSIR